MADGRLRIGLAQALAGADIDVIFESAAQQKCDILLFPEMFSNGYSGFPADEPGAREAWIENAVALDDDYVDRFRQAARRHRLAVVATLLERAAPKPFNTALLINAAGDIVLHQRKRHICFFGVPEQECAAGTASAVTTLDTSAGPLVVGVMICMDREYSDVADDLVRQGSELILVPNSCPLNDDPDIGDVRIAGVRAKAFETVTAIALANYPAPKDDGHSLIVDPLGRVLAIGGREEQLVFGDIDLADLRRLQKSEWYRRVR